ncbi:MAG: ATP-binding cassette domain-containing protein [Alphaproteobacteria bacterium]|nr:ATP-binding cassette domain-containing protein [Alphaproteobacteria bacterium]
MSGKVQISEVSKSFDRQPVLREATLTLRQNSITSLFGRSGAGKTTLCAILAGFIRADNGTINFVGKHGSKRRPTLSLMPQDLAHWNTLNVGDQLALIHSSTRPRFSDEHAIVALAERLGLDHRLDAAPTQLSGGELRRLAFIRAMAVRSDLLILDEPFASVDVETKLNMQQLVIEYVRATSAACLLITHDFDDSLVLAETAAVLHSGQIVQAGAPRDLIENPSAESVARITQGHNLWRPEDLLAGSWLSESAERRLQGLLTDTPPPSRILAVPIKQTHAIIDEVATGHMSGLVVAAALDRTHMRVSLARPDNSNNLALLLPTDPSTLACVRVGTNLKASWNWDAASLLDSD